MYLRGVTFVTNASHFCFHKTYERITYSLFWEGVKNTIHKFIAGCDNFQRHKCAIVKSTSALLPLPIPNHIWIDISMGFIVGLVKSSNKLVIMVVVDHMSKYDHFYSLSHPFTSSLMEQVFMDQIFKLHGRLTSIVSHRNPTFTRNFWKALFKLQSTQLILSTTYHTQTYGQP